MRRGASWTLNICAVLAPRVARVPRDLILGGLQSNKRLHIVGLNTWKQLEFKKQLDPHNFEKMRTSRTSLDGGMIMYSSHAPYRIQAMNTIPTELISESLILAELRQWKRQSRITVP